MQNNVHRHARPRIEPEIVDTQDEVIDILY